MTHRRKFIRQVTAAGIAGTITPGFMFANNHQPVRLPIRNRVSHPFYIGWAQADITPPKPVALIGQLHKRISQKVQDNLTATVLALETIDENGNAEQAVMVSCDVTFIRRQTQQKLQQKISKSLKNFNPSKLFLNATHTHNAPGFIDDEFFGLYDTSDDNSVMKPSEYEEFFIEKVADAVEKAWVNKEPGGYSWGLGHAVIGHNRRTVKTDGTAGMYGATNPNFDFYEGTTDNRVQLLFFWDQHNALTGIVINTTATAQVTDSTNYISADFYHEVRQALKDKYGQHIQIFIQIGAAGDITPVIHEGIYKRAEINMLERKGITARQEIAGRLVQAIDEVYPYVQKNIQTQIVFKHTIAKINLLVKTPPAPPFYLTDSVSPAEIHIIRLDDIAIATNPFELFSDYGLAIKAQSKALLTFIVQLSCHHSGYLPTKRAADGGGYSADKYLAGHEGGEILVRKTIEKINEMWD